LETFKPEPAMKTLDKFMAVSALKSDGSNKAVK
jgi:hypothetical protein